MHFLKELLNYSDYFYAKTEAERAWILRALEHQSFTQVPLLLNIEPYPFENLESLLFRAAARNKLKGISALCQALGIPKRSILNTRRHAQLSHSLQIGRAALSHAIPTRSSHSGKAHLIEYGGHRLRYDQLALSTTRLCPLCVRQSGYGRSYWLLAPLAVCEIHDTALIDHCPTCKAPISLSRMDYAHCQCGTNLLDVAPKAVSTGAANLGRIIGSVFRRDSIDQYKLSHDFPCVHLCHLDLSTLLDLVIFLGGLRTNPKVLRMRKLKGPVGVERALKVLEVAACSLDDWPQGFYAELRKARAFYPRIESLPAVAKSLDHVLELATIAMPQIELRFVSKEIGNFLKMPNEWNESRKQYCQNKRAA